MVSAQRFGSTHCIEGAGSQPRQKLFDGGMSGDLPGNQVVGLASAGSSSQGSLSRGHDITTGLEHLYEGSPSPRSPITRDCSRSSSGLPATW